MFTTVHSGFALLSAPITYSSRLLSLLMLRPPDEDVVGNGVPRVVNASEEQQQSRSSNAKEGEVVWPITRPVLSAFIGSEQVTTTLPDRSPA